MNTEPNTQEHATPVTRAQRSRSIDALRGLGILGILAVNIQYFGMGISHEPPSPGAVDGVVRSLPHILFEQKFITIFSLLFGAGIVLMDRAAQRKGEKWAWRYTRRTILLLVIGLLHAYLLWYGDILVTYAILGFVVFWLRCLKPKHLLAIAIPLYCTGLLLTGWLLARDADGMPSIAEELVAARGAFLDRVSLYAFIAFILHSLYLVLFSLWFNTSLMLMGMALAKTGFLQGERPTRDYLGFIALALLTALPAIAFAESTIPDGEQMSMWWIYVNTFFAPILALGYTSAIVLACTRARANFVTGALAATGRMALTNYIGQSVICVFLFYGGLGGLGLIGRLNNSAVFAICAGIWLVQLVLSPLWLGVFRAGPLEWLWRSLTYLRLQPLKR